MKNIVISNSITKVRKLKTSKVIGLKMDLFPGLELACHAIEVYIERLRTEGESDKLKVHCYRGLLELILFRRDPKLRRSILKTVAKAHKLTFRYDKK